MSGRIDRVDLLPDGEENVVVVDYKLARNDANRAKLRDGGR